MKYINENPTKTEKLGCSFQWFDDESEDWNYSKNCDELCGM